MNYNGQLRNFPTEIVEKMLDNQELQGNPRNVSIFEGDVNAYSVNGGFCWYLTHEGYNFWCQVIQYRNFNLFYTVYPKKINSLPRVMITWQTNKHGDIFGKPEPRLVFAIKNGIYFTWGNTRNEEDSELVMNVRRFNNAKELFDE